MRHHKGKHVMTSSFVCPECGTVIPLPRVKRRREKGHVKTFYCYKCKADRDFQEVRYKDCFETVDGKILYG